MNGRPGEHIATRIDLLRHVRLRSEPPGIGELIARPKGDHDHQEHPFEPVAEERAKAAAVLVPVMVRPGGATLLLTQRAAGLRRHAAQVAFPGGRLDPGETALEAALREAEEEIGLARRFVRPLGFLDAYLTGTGYRIVPVVAEVEAGAPLTLNPDEVEEVFETPLAFLADPANLRREGREWNGIWRSYYAFAYEERYIWGATAGIIKNLQDRLATEPVTAGFAGSAG
jgi:8-oxo-dGTP pyrophosphatase MutT (NUDIX family)